MITEKQLNNLKKLRDHMASLPEGYENFDMGRFAYDNNSLYLVAPEDVKPDCGTACCLAGHGPAAGILPESEIAKVSWIDYTSEAFGFHIFLETSDMWKFLFSQAWPNNIKHAIERLDVAIQYKGNVPKAIIKKYRTKHSYNSSVF